MALYKRRIGDTVFDGTNIFLMLLLSVCTLFPFWYVVVNSFNEGKDALRGGIYFWPRIFSLESYKFIFRDETIINAFFMSVARTILGAAAGVFFTAMVAYAFSKDKLIGRKYYLIMGTITLFIQGGMIPSFILIKQLGLYDKFLVFILPYMFSFFGVIIFQAYFRQLPPDIEESARIDGASDIFIFTKIIIPLSMPIIAANLLFQGIFHWNDYFTSILYTQSKWLQTLPTFIFRILTEAADTANSLTSFEASMPEEARKTTAENIKLATIVVTITPIICTYPFLQKYFVKGMLIGSVKG